jgi:hypothetical protein
MVAATDAQAALEKSWLQAWYLQQYWAQLDKYLNITTAGSTAKAWEDRRGPSGLAGTGTSDQSTLLGATAFKNIADTALTTATGQLATLQATTAAAEAITSELGKRIDRAITETAALDALATPTGTAVGTLDLAAALRVADHSAYNTGEYAAAAAEKTAADTAVKARTSAGTTDGGPLTEAKELADAAWTAAKLASGAAQVALTAAVTGTTLTDLRAAVVAAKTAWDIQQGLLNGLIATVGTSELAVSNAVLARDTAVMNCQVAAYDKYRTTLEAAMVSRADDLNAIRALLAAEETPAPGTVGARCEKAISNGTFRPKRGEMACGGEGFCCGASRIYMQSGTTANAGWRTVETCQAIATTEYSYIAPRAPMATTLPTAVKVPFTCIEGAKKLAAAASAVAAAVYMLA